MLKVTDNSVEQRPETNARLVAPNFGEGRAIAQGVGNLAQGVADVGGMAAKLEEQYDLAAVKQADAEDLKQIATIRAEALSAEGFDAQAAIGDARIKIEEIRKTRIGQLHNQRQRQMYTDVFNRRSLQIEESFASHSITEQHKAEKSATLARADSYSDLSVDTFGTDAFDDNLATTLNEVANANKGAGAEAIGRQQAKVKSSVYARAISGMIADPEQAEHAQMALEAHAADLLPDDEEKLRRQINPILTENKTSADAGWAYSNDPVPGETKADPLAPTEDGDHYYQPGDQPEPRVAPVPQAKPISPADPLRGKGSVSNTALQHRERGSGNAVDIAAPAGTPIYPPMSGKVIKNWWSQEGGWSVLVEHPNGYVTGYAHMRGQSALHEGQAVEDDTVIGGVGMTGSKATGNHVHYTVRQSKGGPKVDPQAVNWGDTVKPESVSWKEPQLQRYEAEQNNLGRALGRLHDRATAENWSPQRYQRAVEKTRTIAGVQDQLFNQQQDRVYDGALTKVIELGDNFTSTNQIPTFGLLEPRRQLSLQNMADANAKALASGDKIKANGDRFLMLMGMAQSPEFRKQFLSVDLGQEESITPGERTRLFGYQLELQKEPDGQLAGSLGKADYFANRYLPLKSSQNKKGFTPEQRHAFGTRFLHAVERQQGELGRQLKDTELDDVARSLTVDVTRMGDGDKVKSFELQGTGGSIDIPAVFNSIRLEVRAQLSQELRAQGKGDTPRNIVERFLATRSR